MKWEHVKKFDPRACQIADHHYSRRTVGSHQFMPPGQTMVLLSDDERAIFGWWRPHPKRAIALNNRNGWTCTIFRNEGDHLSSALILEAEKMLLDAYDCGPDGLMTYIWPQKIRSTNPGYCFKCAGWVRVGRSRDRRKILLQKKPSVEELASASVA